MTEPDFVWPVRVYWEDTDSGGVVYYANYLKFLERARTEWLRAMGVEQLAFARDTGLVFVVSGLRLRYLRPAKLDDMLRVTVTIEKVDRARLRIAQRVEYDGPDKGASCMEAEVEVACVDTASFRPRRIPDFLLERMEQPK
jgi:acyl-CoA thioester hydrolase